MLKIAIVEDTEKDANELKRMLLRYAADEGLEVDVKIFGTGFAFMDEYKCVYDIIFLDIMMPGIDGMELAEKIRKVDSQVSLLFVTDMAQYALKGYSVNAAGFFVKPASYYDLKMCLDRIFLFRRAEEAKVLIRVSNSKVKIMPAREIFYVEIRNKDLTYHTESGVYTVRSESLKTLEKQLEQYGFARCSASYLVNLKKCKELYADSVVVGGDEIKISRSLKKEFVTRLSEELQAY